MESVERFKSFDGKGERDKMDVLVEGKDEDGREEGREGGVEER